MIGPLILSGTTFWVSAALPATQTLADFAALTYTQARGVRSVGDFEKQWQSRPDETISLSDLIKNKRTHYIYPNVLIDMIRIPDAGQTLLLTAADSDTAYSYKVLHRDGTGLYFSALGMSRKTDYGEAANLIGKGVMLSLEYDPIEF